MNQEKPVRALSELIQYPREGIFSKVLGKGETGHVTLMCLAAGTNIDTHTSTKTGLVQVLEGRGEFILQGQPVTMEPGVIISMPADAPHALKADENLAIMLFLFA